MAYSQIPTRTSASANAAADINGLQLNIEALKGGAGASAPSTTIEALATTASGTSIKDISFGSNNKINCKSGVTNLGNNLGAVFRDRMRVA